MKTAKGLMKTTTRKLGQGVIKMTACCIVKIVKFLLSPKQ